MSLADVCKAARLHRPQLDGLTAGLLLTGGRSYYRHLPINLNHIIWFALLHVETLGVGEGMLREEGKGEQTRIQLRAVWRMNLKFYCSLVGNLYRGAYGFPPPQSPIVDMHNQ